MLGFILSKLNLLILVTSIFAIVSFFALGLGDITKVKEAGELATRVAEKTESITKSSTYCDSSIYPFPPDLRTAGSRFYYVMKISKAKIERDNGAINVLIFSVYPREEIRKEKISNANYVAKAIASDSFRTDAQIYLYGLDYQGTGYGGTITDSAPDGLEEIYIDPQAENPMNAIKMLKEISNGKRNLYVLGCESQICDAWKTQIGEVVHPQVAGIGGGFNC